MLNTPKVPFAPSPQLRAHLFLQIMARLLLYIQSVGRSRNGPDMLPLRKCSPRRKTQEKRRVICISMVANVTSKSPAGFSHAHSVSGQKDKESILVNLSIAVSSM